MPTDGNTRPATSDALAPTPGVPRKGGRVLLVVAGAVALTAGAFFLFKNLAQAPIDHPARTPAGGPIPAHP